MPAIRANLEMGSVAKVTNLVDPTSAQDGATKAYADTLSRQKTGNIGDGVSTQIDITHSWGTRAVIVELFRNASPWDTVLADVSRPDTNTVRFTFASAPTSNQFTYVIRTGGAA